MCERLVAYHAHDDLDDFVSHFVNNEERMCFLL